ncbi:unnamed protein product, partial [Ixodes hexagonus]
RFFAGLSKEEVQVRVISEIIKELLIAQKERRDVNLNSIKGSISSKYGLHSQPKIVDIIAAIPAQYKKVWQLNLGKSMTRESTCGPAVFVLFLAVHCSRVDVCASNVKVFMAAPCRNQQEKSTPAHSKVNFDQEYILVVDFYFCPFTEMRAMQSEQDVGNWRHIYTGSCEKTEALHCQDCGCRPLFDTCSILARHRNKTVKEIIEADEIKRSGAGCVSVASVDLFDKELEDMLLYGCTRLEIGVQSVHEDVARDTNRGHTVRAVCESFRLAKDAGFKVVAHMMPNLPNVDFERDIDQFVELFENPAFRMDGLKVYPTLVIRGTGLYELWKTGRYRSYPPGFLVDLIAKILALVPPWTRIYRVQRDIPMPLVTSGVEHGNLRELALARMRDFGTKCRDVRTREVGIQEIHHRVRPNQVELIRRDYVANGGWETFLSYEDPEQDILVGLLRLRRCSEETFRPELKGGASVVRELHVYGSVVPVSVRDPTKFQHQGFGTLLMEEAERIALTEHGSSKIAVISGVGTRNYYRKLGYELDGPYMSKQLPNLS